jgi:hypothetical protein
VGVTFQLERILYLVHISIFDDRLCPNRELELEGVLVSMWQNTQMNKMEPPQKEDVVGKQLERDCFLLSIEDIYSFLRHIGPLVTSAESYFWCRLRMIIIIL